MTRDNPLSGIGIAQKIRPNRRTACAGKAVLAL
jgi:hypothetical protein